MLLVAAAVVVAAVDTVRKVYTVVRVNWWLVDAVDLLVLVAVVVGAGRLESVERVGLVGVKLRELMVEL